MRSDPINLDGLGNWSTTTATLVGGSSATENRTHNKLNEVTAYGVSPASTTVLYDHGNNVSPNAGRGNGNITDDGVRLYAYDALNRLMTVTRKSDNAVIGQYTCDTRGRRAGKVVSNGGLQDSPRRLDALQPPILLCVIERAGGWPSVV